jgi:hypothetical protein
MSNDMESMTVSNPGEQKMKYIVGAQECADSLRVDIPLPTVGHR